MQKIIFSPEKHTYTRESDGVRLMSTSHFYNLFIPTNWVHNVRKAAAQEYLKSKYKGLKDNWENNGGHILDPKFIDYLLTFMHEPTFEATCNKIRAEWSAKGSKSAGIGTENHSKEETDAITSGFSINPFNKLEYPTQPHGKKEDGSNQNLYDCLRDYEAGFYPELLLWYFFPENVYSKSMDMEICGIAGTADKTYLEPNCSFIGDFKYTEKPLDDFAHSYKNHGYEMHTGSWNDWKVTRTSKYRMQLNIYGWMLDEHGLPPKDLRIHNHGKDILVRYEPDRVTQAINQLMMEGL